jgi:hypothetical protein
MDKASVVIQGMLDDFYHTTAQHTKLTNTTAGGGGLFLGGRRSDATFTTPAKANSKLYDGSINERYT